MKTTETLSKLHLLGGMFHAKGTGDNRNSRDSGDQKTKSNFSGRSSSNNTIVLYKNPDYCGFNNQYSVFPGRIVQTFCHCCITVAGKTGQYHGKQRIDSICQTGM